MGAGQTTQFIGYRSKGKNRYLMTLLLKLRLILGGGKMHQIRLGRNWKSKSDGFLSHEPCIAFYFGHSKFLNW